MKKKVLGDKSKLMHKVLIAEDEADIRQLISFNLERESYDTLLAGDGEEAVLIAYNKICLLYTSPSPRDGLLSRMPSSA